MLRYTTDIIRNTADVSRGASSAVGDAGGQQRRIEAFLDSHYGGASISRCARITGGYSRLMAEFVAEIGGSEMHLVWRGDPPPEQQTVVTDRAREYSLLSALADAGGVASPTPLYFDADGSVLGSVGMILRYVEGEQLMTLLKTTEEDGWEGLTAMTCRLAAAIHATSLDALPADFDRPRSWQDHLDGCIADWRALEGEQLEPSPLLRYVTQWLDRSRPPEVPLTLVHGDFQTPNVVVGEGQAAALDWEFAHVGDPREDLGYFLALAAMSPPDPTRGDASGLCEQYRQLTGLTAEQVNPRVLAYFSILPFGPMLRRLSGQVADLVAGRNNSLQKANLAVMLTAMLQGWVTLIRMLDGISTAEVAQ